MASDPAIRGYVGAGLRLLPKSMDAVKARVLMTAIGLQESRFDHSDQLEKDGTNTVLGPALGFWQFERGGGVKGVMEHPASKNYARDVCAQLGIDWDRRIIWEALKDSPALASVFARLLLYTDPRPLPELHDVDGAWDYYVRNWRPGRPHRSTWSALHERARFIWESV